MNLFPSHIILNGDKRLVTEVLKQSSSKNDWENDFLTFLSEWYNEKDFIEVNTSGSTGTPKTIRLQKEFVAASAERTICFFDLKGNDKVLHCLPSKYIAGKLMVVRALLAKLDLYLVDPATDFSILKEQEFKFAAVVPNQMIKLIDKQPITHNPQLFLIGGAAIPHSLEQQLKIIESQCFSSYGMTETATHIAIRKLNGSDADSYYRCLDGILVGLSEEGCLKISMPGMKEALQTTDLAKLKNDNTFRILGRADHVIISGGIKFFPEKIEKKLEPFIQIPFMVSSLPHEKLSQQLVLLIEGEESEELVQNLQLIFDKALDKYERPRQILFTQKLPRTPNGKLKRG